MIETSLVNIDAIPRRINWYRLILNSLKQKNGQRQALMFVLPPKSNVEGLHKVWRDISRERNKTGKTHTLKHQLGYTTYLWWQEDEEI